MKKVIISACLLGEPCRYDGKSKPVDSELIEKLKEEFELIPVCPEVMGGLDTPRKPCELIYGKALTKEGKDCTLEYKKGANLTLSIAKDNDVCACILKSKSPSCGSGLIYDGTFSGNLTDGYGFTSKLLTENGFNVYDENQIEELMSYLRRNKDA